MPKEKTDKKYHCYCPDNNCGWSGLAVPDKDKCPKCGKIVEPDDIGEY